MVSPQEVQVQERIEYQKGELIIKIHGELLNSPHPERRKLFIETSPRIDVSELIRIIEATRAWLKRFSYIFPTNTPWWHIRGCPYCKEAVLRNYNIITSENDWKTAHCLRHASVYFPNIALIVDNKLRVIRITYQRLVDAIMPLRIIYFTQSQKYFATYDIDEYRAEVYWRRDGDNRVIKFKFEEHFNSYPLMSGYATLALNISRALLTLSLELEEPRLANVYLNGELVKSLSAQS